MRFVINARVRAAALAGALLVAACSDNGSSSGGSGGSTSGSGGTNTGGGGTQAATGGTGGSPATGGSPGSGGATPGTGGASKGGDTGSGGTVGSGGTTGTGGSAGKGGGGAIGKGGAGGATGSGGAQTGSGGAAGNGAAGNGSAGASGATGGHAGTTGAGGGGGATSVTCPTPALASGDTNKTVTVGSTSRTYILHVPTAYKGNAPVPLVVDFHPLGGSGSQEEGSSPYKAQTDPEGVVSAYPNGLSGPSGAAWNVGPCCVANVDDVAFAKALVAQVETVACIDTKRVYAVGFSMGGGMSHYVACHAADIFAAVAPASFDLLQENEAGCTPPRPIAEISFRSSNDTVVPYAGGASSLVSGMPVTFLGAVGTFQKWSQIDSCTGSATATDSNSCQYYKSCGGGVQVGLCTMNTGHAPGNATIGWPFIKQFTLP
jgi:polyhydroxybutyrate depolymerase